MNLSDLSISRPTFITCIIFAMLAVGFLSMKKMGVDLFPDVTFPVVTVYTSYPGAGPEEIETLVSKPVENEMSTLSGVKRIRSINREGISQVVVEFTLETDIKYAEQQVRDRVGSAKSSLPRDIKEPVIRRIDPSDQPILFISLNADLEPGKLFDLADDKVRPRIEQVEQVGLVEIYGGRKREIHVLLDRKKLKRHEVSATQVSSRIAAAGQNVPLGTLEEGSKETVFRSLGEFKSLSDIEDVIVNFYGNEVPVRVSDLGEVKDNLVDEKSRAFVNGKRSVFLAVFKQSGANTIAVSDGVKARLDKINDELKNMPGSPKLELVRDSSVYIRANVEDVTESIAFGIILTVIVVFFFLASGRSTIITGLAIPNSLIGAFIFMSMAGFTINIMSHLALSLSVGLLIDDAIVVRENIFRHLEMGKDPIKAAKEGTAEVRLAVIATTLTVIAVFLPIGFLKGVTGQFFKQFGLTICFVMIISLFDALTIAPMLSAYFAGSSAHGAHGSGGGALWRYTLGGLVRGFTKFQDGLENFYENTLKIVVKKPLLALTLSFVIALGSCSFVRFVPKTFLPAQDNGEFSVDLDMDPGTNLSAMSEVAQKVEEKIRSNPEVRVTTMNVGGRSGEANKASYYVGLVPGKQRSMNTSQFKEKLREQLKEFPEANPKVKDYDAVGGGMRPFNLEIIGSDAKILEPFAMQVYERVKKLSGLKDVDIDFKPGKPEFQVQLDRDRMQKLGVSSNVLGLELRTQIEGDTPAKYRENSLEYDIRVRLNEEHRNLKNAFNSTYIPNINNTLVRLSDVSEPKEELGVSKITRMDRSRYIEISADIAPGAGIGDVMKEIDEILEKELKMPIGIRHLYLGQAENFQELGQSMAIAMGLAILFIFLILASLYESFITPYTIMLALPLAICGSFLALYIARESLNIFSMIGVIMLLGVATKNSILLVDYANQLIAKGMTRTEALIRAGKTRLRPILMTSMALIAGTLPIAMGLNEASKQRTSMGVAIIGGLVSSTLLTLIVVPAAYSYFDRFRLWSKGIMKLIFMPKPTAQPKAPAPQQPTREL